jgi:hypothetical protein
MMSVNCCWQFAFQLICRHRSNQFTNTRRISTRIFGSTARRFFGSASVSSPAVTPSPLGSPPVTSPATSASPAPFGSGSQIGSLPPHRRLAEFTTILGDYKLATAVWDVLRKETLPSPYGRALSDGSDVLPLVLAGGPALSQHANAALAALGVSGSSGAAAQVRALVYAVRWEVGVNDFHTERSDGERWLASAAGTVSCWATCPTLCSSLVIPGGGAHICFASRSRSVSQRQKGCHSACRPVVCPGGETVGEEWNCKYDGSLL